MIVWEVVEHQGLVIMDQCFIQMIMEGSHGWGTKNGGLMVKGLN